jgi:hypothetical protein
MNAIHRQSPVQLGQANDDHVAGIAGLRTNFNTKIDDVRLHLRRTNGNVSDHTRMNAEHRGWVGLGSPISIGD